MRDMRLRLLASLLAASCPAAWTAWALPPPFPGVTTTTVASPDGPTIIPNASSIVSLLFVDLTGEVVDVDVTLDIWDDMVHVWHAFAFLLPEARQAIERIGDFLRQRWA